MRVWQVAGAVSRSGARVLSEERGRQSQAVWWAGRRQCSRVSHKGPSSTLQEL